MRRNQSSILVDLLTLILWPVTMLIRRRRVAPAEIKAFYKTAEWAQARYTVLQRDGSHCRVCGRSPKDGVRLNVDHKKPLSKRWDLRLKLQNLQVLCQSCNRGKGGR